MYPFPAVWEGDVKPPMRGRISSLVNDISDRRNSVQVTQMVNQRALRRELAR